MLDNTPIISTMTPAWRDHVSYGDIVSFRFPLADDGDGTPPKARPCLILDIKKRGGVRYAVLAYGTTSRRRSSTGYEVHVCRRADYLTAGLQEPTRFVGSLRLLVPLNSEGFVISRATGAPVLGRLDGGPFRAMNAVRGRIHAEQDIAAERRTHRRRRGGAVRDRDFTVEQRAPRRTISTRKAVPA